MYGATTVSKTTPDWLSHVFLPRSVSFRRLSDDSCHRYMAFADRCAPIRHISSSSPRCFALIVKETPVPGGVRNTLQQHYNLYYRKPKAIEQGAVQCETCFAQFQSVLASFAELWELDGNFNSTPSHINHCDKLKPCPSYLPTHRWPWLEALVEKYHWLIIPPEVRFRNCLSSDLASSLFRRPNCFRYSRCGESAR